VTQGPDGAIYQAAPGGVFRWDWQADRSEMWAAAPQWLQVAAGLEFDAKGRAYVWAHSSELLRLDPATGTTEVVGPGGPVFSNRRDDLLYFARGGKISRLDPDSGDVEPVLMAGGKACPAGPIHKDGAGRLIVVAVVAERDGRSWWVELIDGRGRPVEASEVRLAETLITPSEIGQAETHMAYLSPYVLSDGGYVSRIVGHEMTYVDPTGRWRTFPINTSDPPLRLFSLEAGDERLWIGTILPLTLLSYDPRTGRTTNHGTPTPAAGEIYNMVWSGGRLFYASYPGAFVSRYDPKRPWRYDRSAQANPRQFGPMKTGPLKLHRPRGRARDGEGNVYFGAVGDYGCPDSGVCRIDVHSEQMTSWIYPETEFNSIVHLPATDEILFAEKKRGDTALRFTHVSARTGEVAASTPLLEDGSVNSWLLDEDGEVVYGVHDARGAVFAYSTTQRRIVAEIAQLGFGHHCYEALIWGPDGRIWGLTSEWIFAVDRNLTTKERLIGYDALTDNFYRFGFCYGPDGDLYFLNGTHLMRVRAS